MSDHGIHSSAASCHVSQFLHHLIVPQCYVRELGYTISVEIECNWREFWWE
jgi:hypothetical protein